MIRLIQREPSYAPALAAVGSLLGASAATATAVGAMAVGTAATVGASLYQTQAQKKEASKTRQAAEQADAEAKAVDKARRMNINTNESATTSFGVAKDNKQDLQSTDLLIPRQTASLGGSSNRVGLGF